MEGVYCCQFPVGFFLTVPEADAAVDLGKIEPGLFVSRIEIDQFSIDGNGVSRTFVPNQFLGLPF